LWLVFSLVRYRFFLYAGLLPYLLGAAWAHAMAGAFDAAVFWSGLGGVVLAVVGVESFNEYFDSRMGTDRVFNPDDLPPPDNGSASPRSLEKLVPVPEPYLNRRASRTQRSMMPPSPTRSSSID